MDAVNNTKRICWWDNIKFVMIVLVVAAVCIGGILVYRRKKK